MNKESNRIDHPILEHRIKKVQETIDQIYSKNKMLICFWCGDNIENLENVVLKDKTFYHLKCMTHVHKSEIEACQC